MNVGDVVYLKSGSPELSIISIEGENAFVSWIGYNNTVIKEDFPLACLSKINNPEWIKKYQSQ